MKESSLMYLTDAALEWLVGSCYSKTLYGTNPIIHITQHRKHHGKDKTSFIRAKCNSYKVCISILACSLCVSVVGADDAESLLSPELIS